MLRGCLKMLWHHSGADMKLYTFFFWVMLSQAINSQDSLLGPLEEDESTKALNELQGIWGVGLTTARSLYPRHHGPGNDGVNLHRFFKLTAKHKGPHFKSDSQALVLKCGKEYRQLEVRCCREPVFVYSVVDQTHRNKACQTPCSFLITHLSFYWFQSSIHILHAFY